jgi:hypothetical protein
MPVSCGALRFCCETSGTERNHDRLPRDPKKSRQNSWNLWLTDTAELTQRSLSHPDAMVTNSPHQTGSAQQHARQFLGGTALVVSAGPTGIWRGAPSGVIARGGWLLGVAGWGTGTNRIAGPAVEGGGTIVGAGIAATGGTTVGAGTATTGGQVPLAFLFPAQEQEGGEAIVGAVCKGAASAMPGWTVTTAGGEVLTA